MDECCLQRRPTLQISVPDSIRIDLQQTLHDVDLRRERGVKRWLVNSEAETHVQRKAAVAKAGCFHCSRECVENGVKDFEGHSIIRSDMKR